MFRRIVFSACLAGLIAGILLTAIQQLQVAPIILEAETYEAAEPEAATHAHADGSRHEHDAAGHRRADSDVLCWTGVANIGMAIGFALLLGAAFSLRGSVNWRQGILWGLGGYAAFFALPALGLAPELPGTEAAALEERQAWWLVTVTLSAVGVALLGLTRGWPWKVAALGLIAVPHLIGAPHPDTYTHARSARAPSDVHRRHRHRQRRVLGRARRRLRDRLQEARLTRTRTRSPGGPGRPRHRAGHWRE